MNVRNMKRVARRILSHPEQYDQGNWCGTRACVAGHAFFESGGKADALGYPIIDGRVRSPNSVVDVARPFLGLDFRTADRLFTGSWPEEFSDAWGTWGVPAAERAQLAHDYLMSLAKNHQRKLKAERDKRYRARLKAGKVVRRDEEGEEVYPEHTSPYGLSRFGC